MFIEPDKQGLVHQKFWKTWTDIFSPGSREELLKDSKTHISTVFRSPVGWAMLAHPLQGEAQIITWASHHYKRSAISRRPPQILKATTSELDTITPNFSLTDMEDSQP